MTHLTDTEAIRSKLKLRAALLAKEPTPEPDTHAQIEVMPFLLASERYALETRYIREVWPLDTYVPIPHTPSFIIGVTNVHGEVCSIVDLKRFFSLPSTGITNLNKLVILENDEMRFGILADDVFGTEKRTKSELSPTENWPGIDRTYLKGVTGDRLIVLDADLILKDKRLVVNETVSLSQGNTHG